MTTPAAELDAPDVAVVSEDSPPILTELQEKVEIKETQEKVEEVKEDKNPPTPTSINANLSTPTAAVTATPTSEFEHDGTFAMPPGSSAYMSPVKSPEGSSKGATIIRNRFSTWRQKANENANTLWKQAKEVQAQASANNQGPLATLIQVSAVAVASATATPPVSATARKKDRDASANDKEEDDNVKDEHDHDNDNSNKSFDDDEESHNQETDAPLGAGAFPNIANIPNIPTRKELRSKAQAVAKEVVGSLDTYATGFRGRYASTLEPIPRPTTFGDTAAAAKESQTALILKSRAASHLQEILDSLEPHQYVLLLGAGRLQVNLKDPYNKHQGTYVDFLVAGGAADKSGVVAVGDSIVKVGSQDVRKHTIADVPSIIANARRPVVLVLTEGVELDVERITYLDLAVAMMHRIRAQDEQQKQAMIASAQKKKQERGEAADKSITDAQEVAAAEHITTADETQEDDRSATKIEDVSTEEEPDTQPPQVIDDKIEIPAIRTTEGYASPPQPPREARIAYKRLVGKR
jgi:PDZ domain